MNRPARQLSILLLLLLTAGPAAAGSFDIFGTGARAIALGGAYTGVADGAAAMYYNIAGLTQTQRLRLEVGYGYAVPRLLIGDRAQNLDEHRGFNLGAVISTLIFKHRLSLGLNFFMPDDHMIRFLVMNIRQPHQAFTHNANHIFTALIGAGFQVTDWLSLGAGVGVMATERGGVNITIHEDKPSEGQVWTDLTQSYSPMAGVLCKPLGWFSVGFAFREKMELDFDLPNTIDIPAVTMFDGNRLELIRETTIALRAASNSHFSPRTYELGLAFRPVPRALLGVNVSYTEWSAMRTDAPISATFMSGGLGDLFPNTPREVPGDPDFRDTFNYALGVEGLPLQREQWDIALRGGYRYRPTPVPRQRYANNYLDADAHVFSIGLGVSGERLSPYLPRHLALDGYYQYQYSPPRTYPKASSTDYLGEYRFEQSWSHGGAALTMRF